MTENGSKAGKKAPRKCPCCENPIYGFWRYGPNYACSRACFQRLIAEGKIEKLNPAYANKALGISKPLPKEVQING